MARAARPAAAAAAAADPQLAKEEVLQLRRHNPRPKRAAAAARRRAGVRLRKGGKKRKAASCCFCHRFFSRSDVCTRHENRFCPQRPAALADLDLADDANGGSDAMSGRAICPTCGFSARSERALRQHQFNVDACLVNIPQSERGERTSTSTAGASTNPRRRCRR